MKNINKLALLLKLNMLRSIAASLSWRSPVIALKQGLELHPGRPSSEQLRVCSDLIFFPMRGRPHESQQPKLTVLLSRTIFMYLWIRLSLFIQHTSCAVCFCERAWVFLWTPIQPEFTEHFTFRLYVWDKKKKKKNFRKSVKLNLPN